MAKTRRGKVLNEKPRRGRGTCPVCARTGVKLLWERKQGEDTLQVCKRCRTKE